MISDSIEICNKLGLHARAASKLASLASDFDCDITIEHNGQTSDAKSIMQVMMLAATKGSSITIITDGSDEKEALNAISGLVSNRFEEAE